MSDEEDLKGHLEKAARVEGGIRCAICASELRGTVVACRECQTPYHQDCFEHNGGCAIHACRQAPVARPPARVRIVMEDERPRRAVRAWFLVLLVAAFLVAWGRGPYLEGHPLEWLRPLSEADFPELKSILASIPGVEAFDSSTRLFLASLLTKDQDRRGAALENVRDGRVEIEPLIAPLLAVIRLSHGGDRGLFAIQALGAGGARSKSAVPALARLIRDGRFRARKCTGWIAFDEMVRIDPGSRDPALVPDLVRKEGYPPPVKGEVPPGWRYERTTSGFWVHVEMLGRVEELLARIMVGGPDRANSLAELSGPQAYHVVVERIWPVLRPLVGDKTLRSSMETLLTKMGQLDRSILSDLARDLSTTRGRNELRLEILHMMEAVDAGSRLCRDALSDHDARTGEYLRDPAYGLVVGTASKPADLQSILSSRDLEKRIQALQTIRKRDDLVPRFLGSVIAALDDPEPECRCSAVLALRAAGSRARPALDRMVTIYRESHASDTGPCLRLSLFETIADVGARLPAALEVYRETLVPGNRDAQHLAFGQCMSGSRWNFLPEVMPLIPSFDPETRVIVLRCAFRLLSQETVVALLDSLETLTPEVRDWAGRIIAIQDLSSAQIRSRLKTLLQATDAGVRDLARTLLEGKPVSDRASRPDSPTPRR